MREAHSAPRGLAAIGGWPVWHLRRWLLAFVVGVVTVDAVFIGIAASGTDVRMHDLGLFCLLLLCTAASVELSRRFGERGGVIKDVYGVWQLPVAILLPPAYSLIAPISRVALMQLRVRKAPLHRRVFSFASLGLSYGAASLVYHGLAGPVAGMRGGPANHELAWSLLVVLAGLVQSVLNKAMIMTAVKGADPLARIWDQIFRREPLYNDFAELCIGVLLTYGVAGNPFLAPLAIPIVILLQRSLRHAELLNDSRADAKTGLLNAATWDREAKAEVARAVRTRTSLAVAMLDIDHFKSINDTFGHLVGDEVLKEVAHTLSSLLREYDLAGRFGGEEFAVLLPQTRAVDAFRIAERVRSSIAALSIIAPGAIGGERVQVTVSLGVAALDAGASRDLRALVAAADAALYSAKGSGRNQVQMISTARGLSAVNGPCPATRMQAVPEAADAAGLAPALTS